MWSTNLIFSTYRSPKKKEFKQLKDKEKQVWPSQQKDKWFILNAGKKINDVYDPLYF